MIMTVVHVGLKLIVSVITSVAIGIKCERVVKSDQKTFQLFNPCSQKAFEWDFYVSLFCERNAVLSRKVIC